MQPIGKFLIILGIAVAVVGALLLVFGNIPVLGKLPGDLRFKKENFEIYIPITTSVLLSIVVSVILWAVSLVAKK